MPQTSTPQLTAITSIINRIDPYKFEKSPWLHALEEFYSESLEKQSIDALLNFFIDDIFGHYKDSLEKFISTQQSKKKISDEHIDALKQAAGKAKRNNDQKLAFIFLQLAVRLNTKDISLRKEYVVLAYRLKRETEVIDDIQILAKQALDDKQHNDFEQLKDRLIVMQNSAWIESLVKEKINKILDELRQHSEYKIIQAKNIAEQEKINEQIRKEELIQKLNEKLSKGDINSIIKDSPLLVAEKSVEKAIEIFVQTNSKETYPPRKSFIETLDYSLKASHPTRWLKMSQCIEQQSAKVKLVFFAHCLQNPLIKEENQDTWNKMISEVISAIHRQIADEKQAFWDMGNAWINEKLRPTGNYLHQQFQTNPEFKSRLSPENCLLLEKLNAFYKEKEEEIKAAKIKAEEEKRTAPLIKALEAKRRVHDLNGIVAEPHPASDEKIVDDAIRECVTPWYLDANENPFKNFNYDLKESNPHYWSRVCHHVENSNNKQHKLWFSSYYLMKRDPKKESRDDWNKRISDVLHDVSGDINPCWKSVAVDSYHVEHGWGYDTYETTEYVYKYKYIPQEHQRFQFILDFLHEQPEKSAEFKSSLTEENRLLIKKVYNFHANRKAYEFFNLPTEKRCDIDLSNERKEIQAKKFRHSAIELMLLLKITKKIDAVSWPSLFMQGLEYDKSFLYACIKIHFIFQIDPPLLSAEKEIQREAEEAIAKADPKIKAFIKQDLKLDDPTKLDGAIVSAMIANNDIELAANYICIMENLLGLTNTLQSHYINDVPENKKFDLQWWIKSIHRNNEKKSQPPHAFKDIFDLIKIKFSSNSQDLEEKISKKIPEALQDATNIESIYPSSMQAASWWVTKKNDTLFYNDLIELLQETFKYDTNNNFIQYLYDELLKTILSPSMITFRFMKDINDSYERRFNKADLLHFQGWMHKQFIQQFSAMNRPDLYNVAVENYLKACYENNQDIAFIQSLENAGAILSEKNKLLAKGISLIHTIKLDENQHTAIFRLPKEMSNSLAVTKHFMNRFIKSPEIHFFLSLRFLALQNGNKIDTVFDEEKLIGNKSIDDAKNEKQNLFALIKKQLINNPPQKDNIDSLIVKTLLLQDPKLAIDYIYHMLYPLDADMNSDHIQKDVLSEPSNLEIFYEYLSPEETGYLSIKVRERLDQEIELERVTKRNQHFETIRANIEKETLTDKPTNYLHQVINLLNGFNFEERDRIYVEAMIIDIFKKWFQRDKENALIPQELFSLTKNPNYIPFLYQLIQKNYPDFLNKFSFYDAFFCGFPSENTELWNERIKSFALHQLYTTLWDDKKNNLLEFLENKIILHSFQGITHSLLVQLCDFLKFKKITTKPKIKHIIINFDRDETSDLKNLASHSIFALDHLTALTKPTDSSIALFLSLRLVALSYCKYNDAQLILHEHIIKIANLHLQYIQQQAQEGATEMVRKRAKSFLDILSKIELLSKESTGTTLDPDVCILNQLSTLTDSIEAQSLKGVIDLNIWFKAVYILMCSQKLGINNELSAASLMHETRNKVEKNIPVMELAIQLVDLVKQFDEAHTKEKEAVILLFAEHLSKKIATENELVGNDARCALRIFKAMTNYPVDTLSDNFLKSYSNAKQATDSKEDQATKVTSTKEPVITEKSSVSQEPTRELGMLASRGHRLFDASTSRTPSANDDKSSTKKAFVTPGVGF